MAMSYCPDHDPLVRVGRLSCGECGAESYPVDAMWIGDRQILALFDAGCWHRHPRVVVIDLDSDERIPDAPRPRRCVGVNRYGNPCRAYAVFGDAYCHSHARRVV